MNQDSAMLLFHPVHSDHSSVREGNLLTDLRSGIDEGPIVAEANPRIAVFIVQGSVEIPNLSSRFCLEQNQSTLVYTVRNRTDMNLTDASRKKKNEILTCRRQKELPIRAQFQVQTGEAVQNQYQRIRRERTAGDRRMSE